MKYTLLLLATALLAVSCQNNDTETTDGAPRQYTIEQFMDNEEVFGASLSMDNKEVLVTSNKTGIFNAYTIRTKDGYMKSRTTSADNSAYAISFFPADKRILFTSDNNGDEVYQIFMQDEEGQVTNLTPDSAARAEFYQWAHDGQSFFYGSNKRDQRFMDVYEMPLSTLQPTLVFQNDPGYNFNGISNDKKYLVLSKSVNTNDSDLFLYELATQQFTKVSRNPASHSLADFAPDNSAVYFLTDDGAEFTYLMRYDIATQAYTKEKEGKWDIAYAFFSHGGKYRVVGFNADGKNELEIIETASGQPVTFPKFDQGDITSIRFSRDEKMAAFYVGTSISPADLYVYDLEKNKGKRLTELLNMDIRPQDLAPAQVVRFPSFDGLEIPAIYYKPLQASTENKVPALVWVHGGPGGQSRQDYSPLIQFLVNHGYAVLAVNNRGSSGYGKTFFRMDDQKHGEEDLQDCIYGKKWLQQQDYIDSAKIGIIGGSYGGFMVMAALTSQPEAFEVGVNLFGVTNWLRTLQSIPPWWESFREALYQEMGDPSTADSIRLHRISPLFHAENVVKPVMVLQGAQDPRVLQVESDEIVAAVKQNGVPVEYVLFEDEGHGFVKKENEIEAYGKILAFLDQYLREGFE